MSIQKLPTSVLQTLTGCRILIADDSRAIRKYLREMLESLELRDIGEAQNGGEAMEEMAARPAQILLCDLNMPGMDGVELLREIGERAEKPDIILISSMEGRLRYGVSRMARELGLDVLGVLGKPFQPEELIEALSRYRPDIEDQDANIAQFSQDDLSEALKARRIEMHYQPQVRMADDTVLGFEALVRVSDREGNLVSPSEFIGMSESTGQIHRLSHLILEASIRQLGMWNRMGYSFNLSINLSAATLRKLDLPEHVEAIARNRGVSPRQLTIELTETQLHTGAELYDVMSRFRMKGFGLSIDDFGTGDSSLARLRSMPFTELKIDQQFVMDCTKDDDLRSIVNNSIQLGHELGMVVVAEGVQQADEWELLKSIGCDIGQGYLLSPPLIAAEAINWHHQWTRRNSDPKGA